MKKIRVKIASDGTQSIEVIGARGDECVDFTRNLESRLGVPEGDRTFKTEFDLDVAEGEQEEHETGV